MSHPVELASSKKKVAVVGSGCSGLAAVWALKQTGHDVYLYEAQDRLGGHVNTVEWKAGKYRVDVDTGFIVLNTATYPNFINFLEHEDVSTEYTDMALGVSRDGGLFEWGGKNLATMFCQTRNVFSVRMWRMLFDVVRFNQFALDVLIHDEEEEEDEEEMRQSKRPSDGETIGHYLSKHGYSDAFRDGYLIPITASVWSTSPNQCIDEFPVLTLIRFLWNHHNLSTISARPEWLTLREGSKSYVKAIMKDFPPDRIFLNTPVRHIDNDTSGRVVVETLGEEGQVDVYDHVILATHGNQALSILGSSATEEEKAILSCFETSQNQVVLHSDLLHMPRRRGAWSSWNYMTLSSGHDIVSLTYNMNTLQHIPEEQFGHVLATLNPLHEPDPALTQGRFQYAHPLYTAKAVRAQKRLGQIQNKRGVSFAGAWTKYGFHEDGFSSGLLAARDHLGATLPFEFVDSSFSRGRRPELGMADHIARLVIMMIQVLVVQPLELVLGVIGKKGYKE